MKTFLALYIGNASEAQKADGLSETETHQMMQDWAAWGEKHDDAIVDTGTPLGSTRSANATGETATKNNITGYVIVQANSHDEAARMFVGHPHTRLLAGNAVEVMECLAPPSG